MPERSVALRAALVLALVAVGFGVFMRYEAAQHEMTGEASACVVSKTWDCDKVQSSAYSKVAGVSLSLWGAASHLVLALLLTAWLRHKEATFLWLSAGVALLNVGAAGTAFYIAKFKLGAFCLYCTILQVLTLVIAVLIVPALRGRGGREIRLAPMGAGGLFALAALGVMFATSAFAEHSIELRRLQSMTTSKSVRLDVSDAIVVGDVTTRHSVLLYVDFGCPLCRECYRKSRLLQQRYPADVHFIFKNFPLDKTCNRSLSQTTNFESCRAAFAAAAAHRRGQGLAAMQSFFITRGNSGFTDYFFEDFAKSQGFSVPEFDKERLGAAARKAVADDIDEGIAMDFDRVPMVFLNGRVIEPAYLQQRVTRACSER